MKKKILFVLPFLLLGIILTSSYKVPRVVAQEQCVAVAGDSIASGEVVYEDPSIGTFPVVNTGRLASFIQNGLQGKATVKDYSVPAATLTVRNIYSDQQVVNSNCQYITVGPWVNDLGQSEAGPTINAIANIVNDITSKNPSAKILLVNYYTPRPASWATNIWPKGFSQSRIADFNNQIQARFGSNPSVRIIDTRGFTISDVATSYNGKVADGVHLSVSGKQKLASLLVSAMNFTSGTQPSFPSPTNQPLPAGQSQPAGSGTGAGTGASFPPPINGDKVGPELADPAAGANVVDKNGFKGAVAVINDIHDSVHNTVPSKSNNPVTLRLLIQSSTPISDIEGYAERFNFNGAREFPNGAIIILGNELNNLRDEWKNPKASLRQAGKDYAAMFNFFSRTIQTHNDKYKVAPAPPDMYNGDYDPMPWIDGFLSEVNCQAIDTLVANVFKVQQAASSVGGDVLKTYLVYQSKINSKCPGKAVVHFEGWGADPRASVPEQINFLNTESLPVLSATTLIVDNCDGTFGGNGIKPWLYYIPKPPYVFKADGTPLDPTNCTGAGGLKVPVFIPQDVPCDDTSKSYTQGNPPAEYHSLRPYPASPCKKKVEETALFCGNDLIVKTTFNVGPNNNCTGSPDNFTCTYSMTGQESNLSINLKGAQFPIMGNTELVPNSTDRASTTRRPYISYGQRMNEYVSWYLNGAIDRAEEEFLKIPENVNTLISYSGPLRKLFPWAIQLEQGIKTVNEIYKTRHDQAAGCSANGLPVPCSLPLVEALKRFSGGTDLGYMVEQEYRLRDWQRALPSQPPLEKNYKSFGDYWKDYLVWRGQTCTFSVLGFYLCYSLTGAPNWLAAFFPYIPQSSTEDRKGQVETDNNGPDGKLANTIQLKDGQGNGGTVTNVSFVPKSDNHSLYFAHTEEAAQLGQLLQSTYAAKSTPENNWEEAISRDVAIHNPNIEGGTPKFNTSGCNQTEVRTNPGDNLYGEIDRENEQQISGTLKYDVTFKCQFKRQTDQNCVQQKCANITSETAKTACINSCTSANTCSKDIYTSLGIYTKTPKVQEIWDRLVDGSMSVFKRFFPKATAGAPVEFIKDIPGSTNVVYASTTGDAKAGVTGKSGSEAELYFPHVGSLQEYFLKGIQTALRPKGGSEIALSGQAPFSPQSKQPIEAIQCPGPKSLPSPPSVSTNKCKAPAACSTVGDNDIPSQYLSLKDGTKRYALALAGRGSNLVDQCFNYVVKRSLDAGVNPIYTLSIWVQESAASNYERFGCSLQDMGFNNDKIAADLDAQLTAFLRLPYLYPNSIAPQCFTSGCSIEAFSQVYQQGAPSSGTCIPNDSAIAYANKTRNTAHFIAPNCDFPKYPTETTSCH